MVVKLNAQQSAHQATLYVQTFGGATEEQIVKNATSIREKLAEKAACGSILNVIVSTQDIELEIEENLLTGPELNGNNIWMDASTDWLIQIEPGPDIVTLWGKNDNGQIRGWISGDDGGAATEAMINALGQIIPYPNKNYCAIKAGLMQLGCNVPSLSNSPCNASMESPTDIINTDLEGSTDDLMLPEGIKNYFMAHYCTPIVVISSNNIEYFEREHELPETLANSIREMMGYDEFLLFIKKRGDAPNTADYVLRAEFFGTSTPDNEDCLSLVRQLSTEQLKALEGKNLDTPTISNGVMSGGGNNALVLLEGMLRGEIFLEETDNEDCATNLGTFTNVETELTLDNTLTIRWDQVENADHYYFLFSEPGNNASLYNTTSPNIQDIYTVDSLGSGQSTSSITISNPNIFGVTIDQKRAYSYSIFAGCEGMTPAVNAMQQLNTEAPVWVNAKTGGGFNYEPMGVCQGQTARLGIAYTNNRLDEPCNDNRIYPAVDPNKYSFSWSGPGEIGAAYNAVCNGVNTSYPSRVQVDETDQEDEGVYRIQRTHEETGQAEFKPYDAPGSIVDIAYEQLDVWSPTEEDEDLWVENCQFILEATDLSARVVENDQGQILTNVRKSGNEKLLKVVRNPTNTNGPGSSHEDGVLIEATALSNRTFAPEYPEWEIEGQAIPAHNTPDPGEDSFEIPVDPIPQILPSTINTYHYNVNATASIEDPLYTGNSEAEVDVWVFNPEEDGTVTLDNRLFELLGFICENLNRLKSTLNGLGIPVDNCYDLRGNVNLCFKCTLDQSQYIEKYEEIVNSYNIIRNKSGHINLDLKATGTYSKNICGVMGPTGAFIDWLLDCNQVPCIPKLSGSLSTEIPIQFFHDEQKWLNPSGSMEKYDFLNYNNVFDIPIELKFGIGGSCQASNIIEQIWPNLPPLSPDPFGNTPNFIDVKLSYGGYLKFIIKPTIDVPNKEHKVLVQLRFESLITVKDKTTGYKYFEGEWPNGDDQIIWQNNQSWTSW